MLIFNSYKRFAASKLEPSEYTLVPEILHLTSAQTFPSGAANVNGLSDLRFLIGG